MARPRMIVVAGPPGSGKTTYFPVTAFRVDAFNIDDRCAQIQGSYRAISREVRRAVANECELFVRQHIEQGRSFAVETTLGTTAAVDQSRSLWSRRHGPARTPERLLQIRPDAGRDETSWRPSRAERGRAFAASIIRLSCCVMPVTPVASPGQPGGVSRRVQYRDRQGAVRTK
jgi:hypothetical protein